LIVIMVATGRTTVDTAVVRGLPVLGNALEVAADPARFFVRCYRECGPVFRIKLLNKTYPVIAGVDAANFLGTREGRENLRSKEFWQGLVEEYGATRTILGEDGESHKQLREVMRRGYSRDAIKDHYPELVEITDRSIERDWKAGGLVPVVHAMQYMVTDQLGSILTGSAPMEYVPDIRTTTLYILNVLVTRQRPKILLKHPKYRRGQAPGFAVGNKMIADYQARIGTKTDEQSNLVDDIMNAHRTDPRSCRSTT